jgi:Fuc2NAc and GlcNAc transferase
MPLALSELLKQEYSKMSRTELSIIFIGFICSYFLVSFLRIFADRFFLISVPNARSSHVSPIPNGGGIGFVLTFLLSILFIYFFKAISLKLLLALCMGGILIASIGLLDDFSHIPAHIRIFFHFLLAIWVLFLFHGMPPLQLGFAIWHWHFCGLITGIVGLVWLINLYNFMDGIDGLAASEAVFVATAAATLLFLKGDTHHLSILLLLAMCVLGFLIWNWPPATIFMGDVGSGFLGYTFGVLLIASVYTTLLTPWQWLILFGCFWVDTTITLIFRIIRGKPIHQAHRSHAFQQAVKKTKCHKQVVMSVLIINIVWLFPMSVLSICYPKWVLVITGMAILPLVIACMVLKAGKEKK